MNGLSNEERQRLGALLDHTSQAEVMARIPQFSQAEIHNIAPSPAESPDSLGLLVFNMERGVRIPEDVSLVGYDNIAFTALPRIHLTTVSQHKFQQSRIAVERLLEKIDGSAENTVDLLEPELIIRSTCAKNQSQT